MAMLETTRREFLIGTGALVVSFSLTPPALAQTASKAKPVALDQVDSFLAVHKDGSVTIYTGRTSRQHPRRAAADGGEEPDLALGKVKMIEATPRWRPIRARPGAASVWLPVPGRAAATARRALVDGGAKLGVIRSRGEGWCRLRPLGLTAAPLRRPDGERAFDSR
jgi:hypothetical protein